MNRETPTLAGLRRVMTQNHRQARSQINKTDGTGYIIKTVKTGPGYSSTEYATKELPNGRTVSRTTEFPSIFDKIIGIDSSITVTFGVYVGYHDESPNQNQTVRKPPMPLPPFAHAWDTSAWDGPIYWFADFKDQTHAEEYALSLPPPSDTPFPD
jgi:hypothetical protein